MELESDNPAVKDAWEKYLLVLKLVTAQKKDEVFSSTVSMSADGRVMTVSDTSNKAENQGAVYVYDQSQNGSEWILREADIEARLREENEPLMDAWNLYQMVLKLATPARSEPDNDGYYIVTGGWNNTANGVYSSIAGGKNNVLRRPDS